MHLSSASNVVVSVRLIGQKGSSSAYMKGRKMISQHQKSRWNVKRPNGKEMNFESNDGLPMEFMQFTHRVRPAKLSLRATVVACNLDAMSSI